MGVTLLSMKMLFLKVICCGLLVCVYVFGWDKLGQWLLAMLLISLTIIGISDLLNHPGQLNNNYNIPHEGGDPILYSRDITYSAL